MKISKKKQAQITTLSKKLTKIYSGFRTESAKMDKIISPFIKEAIKKKDSDILHQLLDLTSSVDKNGKYVSGEYIGRFYLYRAINEIKYNKLKKKK